MQISTFYTYDVVFRPTPQFSEMPAFSSKSNWKPPKGHLNVEVFPGQLEKEILKLPFENLRYSNTLKVEWEAIRALAYDRTIVIKKAEVICNLYK